MSLKNLKSLYLAYNYIEKIPKMIINLKSIKEIYIGHNPLISIPESILDLPLLKYLVIEKDSLDKKSIEIIKQLKQKKPKVEVLVC